jgi:hypothetical protein
MGLFVNETKLAQEMGKQVRSILQSQIIPLLQGGLLLRGNIKGIGFELTIKLATKEDWQ